MYMIKGDIIMNVQGGQRQESSLDFIDNLKELQ